MADALRALVAVIAIAVLAGCASPAPTSSRLSSPTTPAVVSTPRPTLDIASIDPCTVVEPSQLAAVGLTLGTRTPVDTGLGAGTACRYELNDGQALVLVVHPDPIGPNDGEAFLDTQSPNPDMEVHGYGDVAWFGLCDACPDGTTTSLTVAASPLEFTIALNLTSPISSQRVLADGLARQIVGGLDL